MSSLEKILELTDAVEQHVERGEWAEASRIDGERCELLAVLLADGNPARGLHGVRAALEQILLRNRLTVARAEAQREELGKEAALFERNARAMRSYDRNTATGSVAFLRHPQGSKT